MVQTAGLAPLVSSCRVTPDKLLAMPALLDAGQVQRRETGGTHAAGLFSIVEDWYVVCEDIGRHNAVDKCVGTALLTGHMPEGDGVAVYWSAQLRDGGQSSASAYPHYLHVGCAHGTGCLFGGRIRHHPCVAPR